MTEQWYKLRDPKNLDLVITLHYSDITISWKKFIWTTIAFQRIRKCQKKRKKFEWLIKLLGVSFLETITHMCDYQNLVKLFFVKSTYASDCKTNKIRGVHKTRIIAANKPTKEPRHGTCYICPMGQDHKPPIHLTLVEYSMNLVNGQPLWRTSVCTYFEPNIALLFRNSHLPSPSD